MTIDVNVNVDANVALTEYYVLSEYNDNEGETWLYFIPYQGNEEALEFLDDMLAEYDSEGDYEGSVNDFHTDTLRRLPKTGGYMSSPRIFDGLLDLDKMRSLDWDGLAPIYKGGISKLFVKN